MTNFTRTLGREFSSASRRAVCCKDCDKYLVGTCANNFIVQPYCDVRSSNFDHPNRFLNHEDADSSSAGGTLDTSIIGAWPSSSPEPRLQAHMAAFSRRHPAGYASWSTISLPTFFFTVTSWK